MFPPKNPPIVSTRARSFQLQEIQVDPLMDKKTHTFCKYIEKTVKLLEAFEINIFVNCNFPHMYPNLFLFSLNFAQYTYKPS